MTIHYNIIIKILSYGFHYSNEINIQNELLHIILSAILMCLSMILMLETRRANL